jgi:multiple sugar transport system substrate-binding protein
MAGVDDEIVTPEGEDRLSRRELLRKAGVGAVGLTAAGSAASKAFAFAGPMKYKGRWLKGDLNILQWVHFVPAYDQWFDGTYIKQWGEKNDVQVNVDHINNTQIPARAAAEVAAQSGHDMIEYLSPPAQYERQAIDHKSIVQEIQSKVGKIGDLGRKSTYNPKTKKWFGVNHYYVPDPVVWRHDYWNGVGESPATWDHVRAAAPKLKAAGHPIGIGQSQELDSNMALIAFLMCFGSFIQNGRNRPTLKSKNTIQAVQFMADIYKRGEENDIFGWNPASNNQYLYSGRGSLILNAISATRTPEDQRLPFADELWIWPIPRGPHGRLGLEHVMGVYSIWKFAKNKAAAQKFVADLCINYNQATVASKLYNFPGFPGAMPFKRIRKLAAQDTHKPRGKYSILTTIAEKYTHNVGYPGTTNAAIDEIFSTFLIPQMFAAVSQGKKTAAQSVADTDKQVRKIFAKWRRAGLV